MAVTSRQDESFWVCQGASCGAIRGDQLQSGGPTTQGFPGLWKPQGLRFLLKNGLLFCNVLPHLPSAMLGGFCHEREEVKSAILRNILLLSMVQLDNL